MFVGPAVGDCLRPVPPVLLQAPAPEHRRHGWRSRKRIRRHRGCTAPPPTAALSGHARGKASPPRTGPRAPGLHVHGPGRGRPATPPQPPPEGVLPRCPTPMRPPTHYPTPAVCVRPTLPSGAACRGGASVPIAQQPAEATSFGYRVGGRETSAPSPDSHSQTCRTIDGSGYGSRR